MPSIASQLFVVHKMLPYTHNFKVYPSDAETANLTLKRKEPQSELDSQCYMKNSLNRSANSFIYGYAVKHGLID